MDGVGFSRETGGNAVALAKKPNLQKISENFLGAALRASGIEVGIPWGEVGSSEVGHANLGSGLVIYQNYPRISLAIQDKSFFKIPAWEEVIKKPRVHLLGLATNSGIHAHIEHLLALLRMLAEKKYRGEVFVHIFTDGEDAPPRSAEIFVEMTEKEMASAKLGKIASITGRYWAMDRNKNWDRTNRTVACLTDGKGQTANSAIEAIKNAYSKNTEDELIEPTIIVDKKNNPAGLLRNGDAAIFFNFRPDRARQLTEALNKIPGLFLVTMTQYEDGYQGLVAFPPQYITQPLAKIISDAGKTQLHIAESEKYAHATYFFNGGIEAPFPKEDRLTIPSPSAPSYDQKPEMAAYEITDKILSAIEKQKYDFIVVNFANGDMVGHTGNLKAASKAIEIVDECLGKIATAVLAQDGAMLITADHGNCEEMINPETGQIDTEHSTNPVPLWIIGNAYRAAAPTLLRGEARSEGAAPLLESGREPAGILADVAPTILEIMQLPQPKEMTGKSLLHSISRLVL